MPPEKSNRRLGRGLDALFSQAPATRTEPPAAAERVGGLRNISIADITANPFQPRRNFGEEELRELQDSLRVNGLLQPVTVRPAKTGGGFELVAGERRLRAASGLGWSEIPAVVKELDDNEMLALALVENLQRSDLNPLEEAEGYERLIRDFGHTQQSVADMVGKDRSSVANVVRILNLPSPVRDLVREGKLSPGQARPLLALEDKGRIVTLAKQIIAEGWSAREVEKRVRESSSVPGRVKKAGKTDDRPAEVRSLEQRLRRHFQTDVTISVKSGNRGSVTIDFYSPDDLERVVERMGLADR